MGFAAADIADWYEEKRKKRGRDLEEWVVENPQWWNVAVATVGATSMEFLGGYVDVLRLGEGSAEGGWGYGKDALRVVSIVPIGKVVRMGGQAARGRHLTQNLQVATKVKGVTGPCTFQAANNAMQIARGKSLFVTVKEMARAVGKPIRSLKQAADGKFMIGAWVDDIVHVVRANGGRVRLVTGLKTIDDVVRVASTEGAPVIFAFRTTVKTAKGELKEIKHSIIAMRQLGGEVKFADYGGKFFATIEELAARWGTRIKPIELYQKRGGASAAAIGGTVEALGEFGMRLQQGAVLVLTALQAIETQEDGVDVAFPATLAATSAPAQTDKASADVIKESFDNFVRRKAGAPLIATKPKNAPIMMEPVHITGRVPGPSHRQGAIVMDPIQINGRAKPPRADWLTGVQFRLNHLGFAAGPVDGVMGPRTERAVRAFQKLYPPLQVDGIPGPRTQAKLAEACGY